MKVLIVNSFFKPDIGGGAELTIAGIYTPLALQGVEVVALVTTDAKEEKVEFVDRIKVIRSPIANVYWHFRRRKTSKVLRLVWHLIDSYNFRMGKIVKNVIKAEKPDVVIFHNLSGWSVAACVAAKRAGLPTVVVLHDLYLLCRSSLMFKNGHACVRQCSLCRLARYPHRLISNKVDGAIGVSKFILDRFRAEGYLQNVLTRVIHNAREIHEQKREDKRPHPSELIFGFIGTISPAKGISWLIDFGN
jgi:glycosyltransferase involved in cell wall biosynthesis